MSRAMAVHVRYNSKKQSSVFKMFWSTRKRKAGVFKFLRFEERSQKAPDPCS